MSAGHITNRGYAGRAAQQLFPTPIPHDEPDATEVDPSTRTLSAD